MNRTLAKAAIDSMHANWATGKPGYCQMWTRQVLEHVYNLKYNGFRRGSAKLSAMAWLKSGLGKRYTGQPLEEGDILYRTHGCFVKGQECGHVGILVRHEGKLKVAENAQTKKGRVSGGKGYRTLMEWGDINVVVKLPDPTSQPRAALAPIPAAKEPPKIVVNGKLVGPLHVKNGSVYAPVRGVLDVVGVPVASYDKGSQETINGVAYAPVRQMLDAVHKPVVAFNNQIARKNRFYVRTG